jgi:hypothetical protein
MAKDYSLEAVILVACFGSWPLLLGSAVPGQTGFWVALYCITVTMTTIRFLCIQENQDIQLSKEQKQGRRPKIQSRTDHSQLFLDALDSRLSHLIDRLDDRLDNHHYERITANTESSKLAEFGPQ